MTSHDSEGAPKTKAERLADLLRAEIQNEHLGDGEPVSGERATNRELDDAIDALLRSIEVPVRRDFQVQLTQRVRSLMEVRRWTLPQLLEIRRAVSSVSRAQLAEQLKISESEVGALETGAIPLWKAPLDPVGLAVRWIKSLGVDAAQAKRATLRLLPRAPAPAFSSTASTRDYEEAANFVRLLTESLDQIMNVEGS